VIKKSLLLFFCILPFAVFAQNSISGKIISLASKKAIPDATVFLSNTVVGTKSLENGIFNLYGVKNGQYDLVVSCIGYETYHQTVSINNNIISIPQIALLPKVTELKEVKIIYKGDSERDKYLAIFKAEFLGHSGNAKLCKLINPEVIDFDYDKAADKLAASTTDFLVIENKALGYRIKYLVKSFLRDGKIDYTFYSGANVFEPLQGNNDQEKLWQSKRQEAYLGSDMHFLRSCINNTYKSAGFKVVGLVKKPNPDRPPDSLIKAKLNYYGRFKTGFKDVNDSIRYYLDKERLAPEVQYDIDTALIANAFVHNTDLQGIYVLKYPLSLHITYRKKANYSSAIIFNDPKSYAIFDDNGVIHNPNSNTMQGHWADLRVAELLPVDYELPGPKIEATGVEGILKKNPTKF